MTTSADSPRHAEPHPYAEQVYAGVLGKVIGVYSGKPFEGASHDDIQSRLGEIWYYVHDRLNYPLVCADDDISGTFTFIRALEDHDAGRHITSRQIGQTWLNYLIENQTVLWWGGMGISTEHTAWLRLNSGIPAPQSGSIAMNGRLVAEQIGAQIFIDAFGLVAPGDPALAAHLAGESARVSHDGEAVFAAQALAAMISAAFVHRQMEDLLDIALQVLPENSLIATVHRDVRGWAARHGDDWRATLHKIQQRYGYDRYGGGCHMVPNHALMVMAWAHAPDDFQKALMIVNTAGWDTDCNAGNVGCVMGVLLGLKGLHAGPDWQGPFADRLLIPTAEGTHGISDVLLQADLVTRLGRTVMGWDVPAPPKNAARFHFTHPGARHGFMPQRLLATQDRLHLAAPGGKLSIRFAALAPGVPARIATPTFLLPDQLGTAGGYANAATPTLYSGQNLSAELHALAGDDLSARLFVRHYQCADPAQRPPRFTLTGLLESDPVPLTPGNSTQLQWPIPSTDGWPIAEVGVRIDGRTGSAGEVDLHWMDWRGRPSVDFSAGPAALQGRESLLGWIANCSPAHRAEWGRSLGLISNRGRGLAHTGSGDWTDYTLAARVTLRLADRAGLAARYGGLRRYVALLYDRLAGQIQLVRQWDDQQTLLAAAPMQLSLNEPCAMQLQLQGPRLLAHINDQPLLEALIDQDVPRPILRAGGIALLSDNGTSTFEQIQVS